MGQAFMPLSVCLYATFYAHLASRILIAQDMLEDLMGNARLFNHVFLHKKQMLKPVKHKEFYVPEAPYPFPPIRSGILLGSSGNGKSNLMLSLLMGPYKNLHSRVIIVSPSVHVDPLWQTWKDFVQKNMTGQANWMTRCLTHMTNLHCVKLWINTNA